MIRAFILSVHILIIQSLFNCVFSQQAIIYSDTLSKLRLGDKILIFEDKEGDLKLEEVLEKENLFVASDRNVPNLGISNSFYWIKFKIKNSSFQKSLFLELAYPVIDEINLYKVKNGQYVTEKAGDIYNFYERKFHLTNYVFELQIPTGETEVFYLRLKSGEQILLPLNLGTKDIIYQSDLKRNIILGIYFGIILAMLFYNLFIFISVRDKSYLYYVFYVFFVGLTQASLGGYSFKYLWPESSWLAIHSIYLTPCITGILAIVFIKFFLQSKSYVPKMDKGLMVFISIYLLALALSLFGRYNLSYTLIDVNGLICSLYLLYMGYKIFKKGYRPALFFLIAWGGFLVSVCLFVLKDLGIIPYTNYILEAGSAFEVILLSFALADRINILKKEKEESQQKALNALRENERIIKVQNVTLDLKVKERTIELQKSNEGLEVAMKNLKDTQSQLVNAEKMASLGQLTAGVAHEINNPINFVSSSIKPLRRDIGDLLTILSKYEELNESNLKEKVKEINDLKSSLDIDFVKEEIDSLLKGIGEGASRTAEIVKGLKTFSRLDETDLKRVDLNEGIDSTLILLSSLMMGKIEVVKKYGNIPKIECFAGKLNQVFMNLLNNAIHAILKKGVNDGEGLITIKTMEKGEYVIVSIKDNGTGIPDKIRYKIFDPFFTTKDVGEGTGLGLSIVYNIIESHKGKIEVESEMGKGTEFIISLPKLQNS